ncbi:MAG: hypothetical protein MMC23_002826 [Stictis urceolatum]|nr:hypothetical protein [Stictis urceolata]
MSPIEVGQRFDSLAGFKKALRSWAIESNFTPAILDSDSHRVRAGCRSSPNCPFRIRCNFNRKTGSANVTTLENAHNCSSLSQAGAPQGIKRAETCKLKFLLEAVPQLMTVNRSTPTKSIIDAVKSRYGQEIAMRQAQKVKAMLVPKAIPQCALCASKDHDRDQCPSIPRGNLPESVEQGDIMDELHAVVDVHQPDSQDPEPPPEQMPSLPSPPHPPSRSLSAQDYQQPDMPISNPHSDSSRLAVDPHLTHGQGAAFRQSVQPNPPLAVSQPPLSEPAAWREQSLQANPPSAAEARMQAARLMNQAGQLMQEAARLNMEAARLAASVAGI